MDAGIVQFVLEIESGRLETYPRAGAARNPSIDIFHSPFVIEK
jgi:hypothetical protein